jgi:hypothetical protein
MLDSCRCLVFRRGVSCTHQPTVDYIRSDAYVKAETPYRDYEVKPANPFLILRRPGDYA